MGVHGFLLLCVQCHARKMTLADCSAKSARGYDETIIFGDEANWILSCVAACSLMSDDQMYQHV